MGACGWGDPGFGNRGVALFLRLDASPLHLRAHSGTIHVQGREPGPETAITARRHESQDESRIPNPESRVLKAP